MKRAISISIISISLILLLATMVQARGRGGGTMKSGLSRVTVSGATYTLETADATTTASNADAMTGNNVFFEYLIFPRLGLEMEMGLTPATRNYQLKNAASVVISNVTETSTPLLLGINLYFVDNSTQGFKPFMGLATGQTGVALSFAGGTLGTKSATHTISLNTIKVGTDWIKDNAGIRLQITSQAGSVVDTTGITGYTQTADYASTVLGVALFAFF